MVNENETDGSNNSGSDNQLARPGSKTRRYGEGPSRAGFGRLFTTSHHWDRYPAAARQRFDRAGRWHSHLADNRESIAAIPLPLRTTPSRRAAPNRPERGA